MRPLAHDEAIDAWFSWQARGFGVMRYDPVYHGPLRFYLEGFVLEHFGTTAGWARLVAALAGIATTVVIACAWRQLGRVGAPVAALVFTVSPTALTVTRTGREDSLVALVSVALLLVVAAALVAPRPAHVISAGALVAVSASLKETTFIFGFAGACFFGGLSVAALRDKDGPARRFFRRLGALGSGPWKWSVVAFLAVFLIVYSSMFRYPEGVRSGFFDGINYWLGQHEVRRGGQSNFFYATVYVAYEWLVLGLAIAGAVVTVRRRSLVGAWFLTMSVVQFVVYSWAGEKFAWLALHPLLPLFLLAGLGAEALARRAVAAQSPAAQSPAAQSPATQSSATQPAAAQSAGMRTRLVAGVAFVALTAASAAVAVRPAITDGDDPRELLVTVQTSREVPAIAERLIDGRRHGSIGPMLIDERDSGSWPWVWYLHGLDDVEIRTIDTSKPLPSGFDAYVVSASGGTPIVPTGFELRRFVLRSWWLPDYSAASAGDLARWALDRTVWNPTGSTDQFLIIRSGAAS